MADTAREKLAGAVEETLTAALLARGPEPGPPIIRRLTHSEYRRSVRDLLAVDFDVAGAVGMPEDPIGKGYDNLADALKIPPALTEKYLAAADEVLAKLFGDGAKRGSPVPPGASIAQMFRTATTPQASSQLARTLISRFLPRACWTRAQFTSTFFTKHGGNVQTSPRCTSEKSSFALPVRCGQVVQAPICGFSVSSCWSKGAPLSWRI